MDLFTADAPETTASDRPWTLDLALAIFLNRWIPRVLSEENRPTIEAELRALIADAKEHQ